MAKDTWVKKPPPTDWMNMTDYIEYCLRKSFIWTEKRLAQAAAYKQTAWTQSKL